MRIHPSRARGDMPLGFFSRVRFVGMHVARTVVVLTINGAVEIGDVI
jgi:hypothetical protein